MPDRASVDAAAAVLRQLNVEVTSPALYPQYAADYYAVFFEDPDGIRLELVAHRKLRQDIVDEWNKLEVFLNPLAWLRQRGR